MYISKLKRTQIIEMLKTMMLQEAKSVEYYQNNLSAILDGSLFEYRIVKNKNSEYVVTKIRNGDLFVFDDCNYIKFEMPTLHPISLQKNTNVYNTFMRSKFSDFYEFEAQYNSEGENIVNIVNFCDELLQKYKQKLQNVASEQLHCNTPNPPHFFACSMEDGIEY